MLKKFLKPIVETSFALLRSHSFGRRIHEHLILKESPNLLKDPVLQTILIEVNDDFAEQREGVKSILESTGWQLQAKRHGDWADQTEVAATFNQIWIRQ